jgi:hypothetical protein|tara:strand:+ start:1026 stop:1211 length:186 start_codon:yes stop_codon:yes gene_type:complete
MIENVRVGFADIDHKRSQRSLLCELETRVQSDVIDGSGNRTSADHFNQSIISAVDYLGSIS